MGKPTKTKYAILGALSLHPMSGYDIKKWTKEVTGSFWAESPGQIYPTLSHLLQESLITCDHTQGTGKRQRKVYALTTKGLDELKAWLCKPANESVIRDEFLLKIFFGNNMPKRKYIEHLTKQKERMQEKLICFKNIKKNIQTEHKKNKNTIYQLITLKKAFKHIQTEINWCNEAIKIIKQEK